MSDTNFSIWNPGAVNQENDSTYAGDSQRSGGAVSGPFSAPLANKVFYQSSIFNRAMALMLVAKGYSPKDGTSPYTPDASSNSAATALASVLANMLTQADVPEFVNNTPVTVNNPVASGIGSGGIVLSTPAGYGANTKIARVTGLVRCTSSPSAPVTPEIQIADAIHLYQPLVATNFLVASGDWARLMLTINLGTNGVYGECHGLSNGAAKSFYSAYSTATLINFGAFWTAQQFLLGNSTGSFSTDMMSTEIIPV